MGIYKKQKKKTVIVNLKELVLFTMDRNFQAMLPIVIEKKLKDAIVTVNQCYCKNKDQILCRK